MLNKINFIYFAIFLAISTQMINYLFVILNTNSSYSIYKQSLITTTILLPFIFLLNYAFNIYYKYYITKINYSTLYITFIVISIFVSFFIQYLITNNIELKLTNILGFILSIIGIYLIIN